MLLLLLQVLFCLLLHLSFSSLPCNPHYHLHPRRCPGLGRKQFGLSSGRQPATLAQIPAGTHRDGRSGRLGSGHPPAPPHWPPGRPPPSSPQSRRRRWRLGSLPAPPHSQPRQPIPLPTPRFPDRLQTPRTARHRAATECRCGPSLNTPPWQTAPSSPNPPDPTRPHLTHPHPTPQISLYYPLIMYLLPFLLWTQYTPICRLLKRIIINKITNMLSSFSSPSFLSIRKADFFFFFLWYSSYHYPLSATITTPCI